VGKRVLVCPPFGVDNRKDFQIEMVGNKKTLPTLPGSTNGIIIECHCTLKRIAQLTKVALIIIANQSRPRLIALTFRDLSQTTPTIIKE